MTNISARSAVRLTQFVGLLFGDVSSEWRKDNWLVESSNISGNISCWWHIILHLHPGRLAWNLREENLEEENHLNQTIVCWFNVNLRACIKLLDVCLFHSLQFGSNWCTMGDTSSCVDTLGILTSVTTWMCCFVVSTSLITRHESMKQQLLMRVIKCKPHRWKCHFTSRTTFLLGAFFCSSKVCWKYVLLQTWSWFLFPHDSFQCFLCLCWSCWHRRGKKGSFFEGLWDLLPKGVGKISYLV